VGHFGDARSDRSFFTPTTVNVSSLAVDVEITVSHLTVCLVDVNDWMRANRLRLNADKTQLVWFGSRQQLEINADVQFMSANLRPLPSVHNLGVILDSRLTEQVTAICRACYYQLRQLRMMCSR